MLTDIVEALDRRHRLAERGSAEGTPDRVLVEAYGFLCFLKSEPRLSAAFGDLCQDAVRQIERYREADVIMVQDLIKLRTALVERYPTVDDSSRPRPGPDEHDTSYQFSLAAFNQAAADNEGTGVRLSLYPDDSDDDSRAARLLRILQSKYQSAVRTKKEEADDAIARRLWNAGERITRMHREWTLFARASLEAAALRLVLITRYVLPEPRLREATDTFIDLANQMLTEGFHPLHDIRARVFGERESAANTPRDARLGGVVQGVVARVYEGVRARLGTARSHRALVERFRLRAELYGAAEMRAVAESQARPEDALADRLARFLFDQGLNPLTRPLTGRLEPDLLDPTAPWTLYVEAKQYASSGGARRTIVHGMRQVWDTLSRLQGHPNRVREAFYVVFRRGGPRYVLPEELRSEGVTVYPVLVDIAEARESGSQQRNQPILIDAADLLPASE